MTAQRRPHTPITINQRVRNTTGQHGGSVDTWTLVRNTRAFVEDKSFREENSAGRIISVTGKLFRIRRDDTINASNYQIVYKGLAYNIRRIKVDDRNVRSQYTIIEADSGVAQ